MCPLRSRSSLCICDPPKSSFIYLGPSRPGAVALLGFLAHGFQEHGQNSTLVTQVSLGCVKIRVLGSTYRGSDIIGLNESWRAAVLKLPPTVSLPLIRSLPGTRSLCLRPDLCLRLDHSSHWITMSDLTTASVGSLFQARSLPQIRSRPLTGSLSQLGFLPD